MLAIPPNAGGTEMDLNNSVLTALQLAKAPVGTSKFLENLYGPFATHQDNLKGVLLLRTHNDAARKLIDGLITLTLAGGLLGVGDLVICVLIVVLGERIYPIYLDPLNPETVLALKQVVQQEYVVLGAVSEADQLGFHKYPLPPANMFHLFANPPKGMKRWTPTQFTSAVEAVTQAFKGDIEGLLDSMHPRYSLAELRFGLNLQTDRPLH